MSGGGAQPRAVVIVDDHRSFADLLAAALNGEPDFAVIGCVTSIEAALDLTQRTRADLVVMDIQLGRQDGIEATRSLRARFPELPIVVVSAHADPAWVARAASAGASGFAPKSGSLPDLLAVLRRASVGEFCVAASLTGRPAPGPAPAPIPEFTARERDVLSWLNAGLGPAQIARVLAISEHTCRGYVKSIRSKLGVPSQLAAVAAARRLGLVGPGDGGAP